MKKKLLIVAAHPDDEILGWRSFISKYKGNYDFKVMFLAEGSSCRYKDLNADKEIIKEKILLRKTSSQSAKFSNKRHCFLRFALWKIKHYS